MRLWVTRTQPGADATAGRLRSLGHEPVVAPVLETRALPDARIDLTGIAAIAFTSPNGVAAFADLTRERGLPAFATGEATAQAARDIGFADVAAAEGDLTSLAQLIGRQGKGPVAWIRPTEPAGDLSALLAPFAVEARAMPIYETVATDTPAPSGIDGLLIHSPKAARLVSSLIDPAAAAAMTLFAISPSAAAPLAALPFMRVATAPRPEESVLLSLLAS